jgi:hypothetical protein
MKKRRTNWHEAAVYASLLITSREKPNQLNRHSVSLSFLCFHYPRKLFRHLQKDCGLTIEKYAPGIYYILNDIYRAQVLVSGELSEEENLYLKCLTDQLDDHRLINKLSDDYIKHYDDQLYIKYMNQLTNANQSRKGESSMVCEGILNICGTSSKEIEERTRKETAAEIQSLTDQNKQLSSENNYYRKLLTEHGIAF